MARRGRWRAALLAGLALALFLVIGRSAAGTLPAFVEWVERQGTRAALVYVLGYAAATVLLIPGSLLTLAAGALFGVVRGTALAFTGALLGSVAAFLVSRHLTRPTLERRFARDPRFRRIDAAVEAQGLRIVLLLRLSPVLPFTLLNYALGITRVRLRDYLVAAVGMLPGTLLYVWSGSAAGEVAALASGGGPRGAGSWGVLLLGMAATAAVTVVLTRLARRALAEAGADG